MHKDQTSLSRRSFLDVAVGSLVSLPVLAGGLIMGPATAHADENGNINYDNIDKGDQAPAKYTIIDVVRPYEVGFIAVDVTKVVKDAMGNDSFERLTGKKVHVRVISRYGSKKTAENDTNNDGVANIDIKQLAENPDKKDVNNLDTYACNATVQVTCEGYRSFETSLMRVTGGSGLMIPLHPADAKGVWPYRASFDEWDVLYTKNQFVQSTALKDDHTIQIVARGIASTDPVTVEMLVDGEDKPRQTVKATPRKGEVTAEFKGHFLQKGDAAALPVGKVVKIVLRDRDAPYAWTLALDLMEAVVDEPTSKENTKLTPFNTAGSSKPGADVKWPSGAPLVSGGSLKFWTPDLPVGLYVNPFGYAQFTLKTPSWGYKSDDGALVKGKWGQFPIKSVKDQWNGMLKDAKLMGDKTNALVSKPGSLQQLDLFKSLSLKANFQFVACAQWDNKKGLFQGEASGQILVAADFTITENFFAGPIPVLISFSLNASFVAALNAACYSATKKKDEPIIDAIMDFGRWQWDYVNSGFTMTLGLTPSLSVGVGIRGIASVSVKGSITLSLFTGFKSRQVRETTKDLPNPHFTAGWSAQISLVLHLFLFTQNFVIRESKFKNFYDNWEGKDKGVLTAKSDEDEDAAALEAMSAGDLMDGMKIITDDMLRKTLDVKLNAQGIGAQSEDNAGDGGAQAETAEPIDWDAHMREEVIPLEDGTPMTYLVYDLSATASEKPAEGATATKDATSVEGEKPAGDTQNQEVPLTEDTTDTKAKGSSSTAAMSAALPFSLTTKAYADTTDDMTSESVQNTKPTSGASARNTTGEGEMGVESNATGATGSNAAAQAPAANAPAREGELGYQETQPSEQGEAPEPQQEQGAQQSLGAQSDTGESDGEWLVGMADNEQVKLGVAGLGTYGGIRPTADTKIFSNVFGDPRAKVISIEAVLQNKALKLDLNIKATLSFRIASVQLADGKVRTRVVANVIDCNRAEERGLSRVIEFETKAGAGIDHADLYDCDFDLDVINFTQKSMDGIVSLDMLCIALVSGRRKEGDGTKLADAATDLVFSCHVFRLMDILGYDIDGKKVPNVTSVVRPPAGNSSFSMRGTQITGDDKSYVHSISSLQVVREGTNVGDVKWIVSFLDRRAKDPKDVLGNESGKIDIRLGVAVWNFSKNTFSPISTESTRQKLGDIGDLSIFEHVLYPKIGNEYTLMLRGSEKAYYYLMSFGLDNGTITSAKACTAYDSTTRLTYWTGNNAFLVSFPKDKSQLQKSPAERDYSSWTLHKATWGGGNKPELQMTPVGPAGFNISAFALNQAGTFMFWPQAREKDVDRVFNAEGVADERELAASYHIMACRLWKGTFSEPFIVADLSHDTDVLAVLKTDHGAAVEMLGTEFVKGDDGLYTAANIWHTMVPGVRSVTAVGCEAVSAFVNPGAKATFHVALRNDGNTFLKGCKLTLCVKKDGGDGFDRVESASATVTFSKDTIQESNWNQMVNGKLTGVEPDYALAPGKTSVHAVVVTIPADWHGEKKVLFVASEPAKADGDVLKAQADEDDVIEVEYSVEPGDYQVIQRRTAPDDDYEQRYMETIDVDIAGDEETFWQAPVTSPANDDDGSNGGGGSGATSASRSTLPRTDDPTRGALPLGVAAAGAGLVAYSRRRERVEKQARDTEG